ncbi:hypothetical protein NC796_05395 [Aliifodinibius sp. S!AR15-10]|uniref:hypothetical protein n=1 Tax=Aliifodinibius sp. S!AR15-10 TaxID=2950437 RepID=UPI002862634A|nr:hypothetical protein [Aliifodinibius sp. S!AR15-10]MDR8390566.1 hypothetical protein [Aliifodinibius sp. S!AR15-10]
MRIGKHTFRGFLFSLVVFLACQAPDAQETSIISVEQESVGYSDEITFHFENITGQTIAVITTGCGTDEEKYLPSFFVEKREQQEWVRAGAPVCIAIATPPILLESGDTKTIDIPADLGLETSQIPGEFRYVFDIRTTGPNGNSPGESKIAIAQRVSPAVRIETSQ